jgi:hypothetical protein
MYSAYFVEFKELREGLLYVFYINISQIKTKIDVCRIFFRTYETPIDINRRATTLIKKDERKLLHCRFAASFEHYFQNG